jgi:hypothetical protein
VSEMDSDLEWMQTTTAPNGEVYVRVRDVVEWLLDSDAMGAEGMATWLRQRLLPGEKTRPTSPAHIHPRLTR